MRMLGGGSFEPLHHALQIDKICEIPAQERLKMAQEKTERLWPKLEATILSGRPRRVGDPTPFGARVRCFAAAQRCVRDANFAPGCDGLRRKAHPAVRIAVARRRVFDRAHDDWNLAQDEYVTVGQIFFIAPK